MCLWLEIIGVSDSTRVVQELQRHGLLVMPGKLFKANGEPSSGIMMCFSTVPEDGMEKVRAFILVVAISVNAKRHERGIT